MNKRTLRDTRVAQLKNKYANKLIDRTGFNT